MADLLILSAAHVKEMLDPSALRVALEVALVAQSEGKADVPPRIAAVAPNGLLAAMPGYLDDGGDGLLATKLVAVYPGNVGLPSHQGLIAYFEASTGTPLALMDAEIITEDRTAGTAAIAADLLTRPDASVLTIVGAGAQGRAHVDAFGPIRPWDEIRIVSRNRNRAVVLGAHARERFDGALTIADDFDEFAAAVSGSDVVALCTHANSDVIDAAWVDAGCHVSSVGSMAELPRSLVGVGPLVVDHVGAVTTAPPAGAAELQHLDPDDVVELGSLISGVATGRTNDNEVTVYKSTGHAVQDVAAAHLVYQRAVAAGVGSMVEL